MRTVPAGVFKAKCLAILDEVNATGKPVLVTKRGKPVARVDVPIPESKKEKEESIFGFLRGMISIPDGVDLTQSLHTEEEWEKFAEIEWNRIKNGPDK